MFNSKNKKFMKQLFLRPMGQFAILATLVFSQFVFAGEPLKDDDDQFIKPNGIVSNGSTMESSLFVNDITIDMVGTDLIVNFNSPIGIATVTIKDKNGNIAYQTTVDTNSTSEVIVPTDLLDEGNNTVTVSYGTTVYSEQIQL